MLSLVLYSLSSMTVSAVVVLYAIATRIRFYPVVVFLFTSKVATVTMINLALVFAMLVGLGFVRLFLGRLRDTEVEAVWENMRFTATETIFALSTFRDEVNARVGVLFGVMLFAKVFQVLNEARVEHVEQAHQTTWKAHARMIALSTTLFLLNGLVLAGCAVHLSTYGPSVYLLFAFEHGVLLVSLFATICRYAIAVYDLNFVHGRWQNKSQYEMYVALISDALQFAAYATFACVVFTYYGVPLHLMRSLYMTLRNLLERARHFRRYRKIMNSLNERFPDATEEELNATDRVCIICREDMELVGQAGAPKKLQCGHLFHSVCLQNWLERQFSCPTCRRPIPIDPPPRQEQRPAAGAAQAQQPPPAAAPPPGAAVVQGIPPPGEGQVAPQAERERAEEPARNEEQQQGRPNREATPERTMSQGGMTGAAAAVQPSTPARSNEDAERNERVQAILRRSMAQVSGLPSTVPADSHPRESGEEEKTTVGEETSASRMPLSPMMQPRRSWRDAADSDPVLFTDLNSDKTSEERLRNRIRLMELEERVYQAQVQAAREAQAFALKVLQLQQQSQQQ